MAISSLTAGDLRVTIEPQSLGFSDTSELVQLPLPWIGQERAQSAARFGLAMDQPDYNLFVLGEVGSGRSTLLRQLMQEMAVNRPVPPDLCYLHNFVEEARAYAELDAFAEARSFALYRENGHLVFTLLGEQGNALTENEARSLPKERRTRIEQAEQELREAIARFLDKTRPLERVRCLWRNSM